MPDARGVIELVREGVSTTEAARRCGLSASAVFTWLRAGGLPEPPKYHPAKGPGIDRMSAQLWRACVRYRKDFDAAVEVRKQHLVDEALATVRQAATKGFARAKVRRKLVAGQVVEEHHESEQGAPAWQAAAWLLERTLPEEYALRTKVEVSGDLRLEPGEADAVAAACSDEEAKSIDRGDVKVLAQVLARVRAAQKKTDPA